MIRTGLKRALIGPPLATSQLIHERISKLKGLAVFSSDALSSTAYATEEILIVLVTAGTAAVALINLRGVRESATIFAVPTYLFIGAVGLTVIVGLWRTLGQAPLSPQVVPGPSLAPISLWLILRAYASGSAAMTGVEAISNGIPAFRPPEARNAGITLIWMAGILIALFVGLTFLAHQLGIAPNDRETVVSQIVRTILGTGPFYFLVQASTALILILAANTSFADFPRLASILASDGFLPRQLANLGDRLVFANGIVVLALLSGGLVYLFRASTHALIPLYALGVFLSFTLSQAGMVKRWWTHREPGWIRHMVINGIGATVTAIVLVVVVATKFLHGPWIVLVLLPVNIWMMYKI